jgi:hypothetical protein
MVIHICNFSYVEADTGGSWADASQGKKPEALSEK